MEPIESKILSNSTRDSAREFFDDILDMGMDFKEQDIVRRKSISLAESTLHEMTLPTSGESLDTILAHFEEKVLPHCTNFGSRKFLGFPDAGNSIAALGGSVLQSFLQQNLINQSFCSPSGTLVEIAVIRWLREAVGYDSGAVGDIWDVGGVITPGGTVSNAIGMLLARENKVPGTLENGVTDPSQFKVVVPKGIGHYSVKSAQMWIGCGTNLIEVDTIGFRYDLAALRAALSEHKGSIMAVVAYAGDSRTMTVDDLDAVAELVREIDPGIWLHADACHGFSLGFSSSLKHKIRGIEKFDSISADPHKVMLAPYTVSALLVRDPQKMRTVTSKSDLIMQEQFAFGQITPFLGSKPWLSLKLWFMMRHFGKQGLDELITKRHALAVRFAEKLREDPDFVVLNEVDINSVGFFYTGARTLSADEANRISKGIHASLAREGEYHLHQFSIPDDGVFERAAIVYPLRFMCGNPAVTESDLNALIEHVRKTGRAVADLDV